MGDYTAARRISQLRKRRKDAGLIEVHLWLRPDQLANAKAQQKLALASIRQVNADAVEMASDASQPNSTPSIQAGELENSQVKALAQSRYVSDDTEVQIIDQQPSSHAKSGGNKGSQEQPDKSQDITAFGSVESIIRRLMKERI